MRYAKLFKMIRVFKINKLLHFIEDLISDESLALVLKFVKLNLLIFVFTHWIACFMYLLGS